MVRTRQHVPALDRLFFAARSSAPSLRLVSLLLALCCFWSFAGAGIALAAAPDPERAAHRRSVFPHAPAFRVRPSAFEVAPPKRGMAPAPKFWAVPLASADSKPAPTQTLLDEAGRPLSRIPDVQALSWRAELAGQPAPRRAALLHLWLGEWQLGQNQQPETARTHFRQAQHLLPYTDRLYGLAAYDSAVSLFYQGAYEEAAAAFNRLLPAQKVFQNNPPALRGYDRRHCALWLRHAAACAGYHADHARLGIPEPPRLDPLCGVASLAACLRGLSLPFDQKTLRAACRVTGEGSTLNDLLASGPKLGVALHAFSADEEGLKRLPKPLVAYVEHDHFIAVVRADNAGVSYLCSDCGAWPGGRVNLSWKQWRTLNPGVFVAATRPGSFNDRLLTALTESPLTAPHGPGQSAAGTPASLVDTLTSPLRLSYRGTGHDLHLSEWLHFSSSLAVLRGHVVGVGTGWQGCGFSIFALACLICAQCCPFDSKVGDLTSLFGPLSGDPVNLATGEEEYTCAPDLTVYNPRGPAVVWQRGYRSLRPSGTDYQSNDFGTGWTQPYNVQVNDPASTQTLPQLQQNAATGLSTPGADVPAAGVSWDILLNGSTVATSAAANSWIVTFGSTGGQPTLTPPASAAASAGYEIRYNNTYLNRPASGFFDVVPAASVAQGRSATFAPNGSNAPAAGQSWDIVQGSIVVASASSPNGWTASANGSYSGLTGFSVTAPQFAPLGAYTVRGTVSVYPSGTASGSAAFSVYAVHYVGATTGTKSLVLADGGAVGFTAPAVPSAGQPRVQCSVQPGVPMLIEWDYAPGLFGGYFTVTMADRTKWITTGFTGQYGSSGNRCFLSQVVNRNGNAINMVYGGLGSFSLPLLSAITDSAGSVLLSIGRNGAAISSVSDAYGRSVFYQSAGSGLSQVSQVVPTGTAASGAPARYSYGYANVNNPEGQGGFYFLHTITVPSPTGSGTSTATINYANGSMAVSSVVDGSGNTHTYAGVNSDGTTTGQERGFGGSNYTRVTVTDAAGATPYSYVVSYDGSMNETGRTDGRTDAAGHYTTYASQKVFSDPNDPFRPSAVYDGNGATAVPSGTGPFVPQGRSQSFAVGSSTYAQTPTWKILLNGASVATGEAPNGWTVSYSSGAGTFTVGAPLGATAGSGYTINFNTTPGSSPGYGPTGTFSVLAAGSKPPSRFSWDSHGNLVSRTSPRGTTTTYTYSYANFALGELTQVQQGAKAPTTYAYYEPSGRVQSVTGPLPGTTGSASTATTSYTYDALGNLLTVTAPGNNAASTITTTLNYTQDGSYSQPAALGQPLTVTDNLGKVTHLRYDVLGRATGVKDALGNETDFTYTIGDAPLQTILPATGQTGSGHGGSQAGYLFAEPAGFATAQWPAATLQYGPAVTGTVYDESGTAIRQTVRAYGKEGETLSVTGSVEPVSYVYDALYRLKTLTDGGGHTTSYFYNPAGYLAQVVYPGAQATPPVAPLAAGSRDTTTFPSYDPDGNLLTRVDGNNVATTYTYNDPESALTDITYPAGSISAVHLAYDAYGRRSAITDGTGGQTYVYDDDNELTGKSVTWTGFAAKTLSYTYYPNGSRQSMTADGRAFAYRYDGVGRMSGLTNDNNEVTTYGYQDNGWLGTKTLANGVVTTFTRDAQGRLRDLVNKSSGGATLSDFAVPATGGYDGVGNRLSVTATIPGAPANYSGMTSYAYDYGQSANPSLNRSQLTGETSTRASGTFAYGYDGGTSNGPGNPTSFKGAANTFNSDNQILTGGIGYDGNGNPTTCHTKTVTFDPENRLSSYTANPLYQYDGDGHLVKTQKDYRVAIGSFRLYDGDMLLGFYNYSGTSLSLFNMNTFGADGLVSVSAPSYGTAFFTFDERGSTAQRLDSTGAVKSTDVYDAYGKRTSTDYQDAAGTDNFGYGGQAGYWTDSGMNLILCTHRFYDPQAGRWLTRDPIGYGGGINLYGYTKNNPGNRWDPSGLYADVGISAGEGIGIIFGVQIDSSNHTASLYGGCYLGVGTPIGVSIQGSPGSPTQGGFVNGYAGAGPSGTAGLSGIGNKTGPTASGGISTPGAGVAVGYVGAPESYGGSPGLPGGPSLPSGDPYSSPVGPGMPGNGGPGPGSPGSMIPM